MISFETFAEFSSVWSACTQNLSEWCKMFYIEKENFCHGSGGGGGADGKEKCLNFIFMVSVSWPCVVNLNHTPPPPPFSTEGYTHANTWIGVTFGSLALPVPDCMCISVPFCRLYYFLLLLNWIGTYFIKIAKFWLVMTVTIEPWTFSTHQAERITFFFSFVR